MTKKIILPLLLFILLHQTVGAQNGSKNIYYIDIGLNLFFIGVGINYERMLNDNFSIRVGSNIGTVIWSAEGNNHGISFPVTLNYMTKGAGKFEIGGGAGLRINLLEKRKLGIWPAGRIGYRHQPKDEGFMWRAGFDFPANCYFSMGSLGYAK